MIPIFYLDTEKFKSVKNLLLEYGNLSQIESNT